MTQLPRLRNKSYIHDAVYILDGLGAPQHIKELARAISSLRGKQVSRASVEASLWRHITTFGNKAKIAKFGPSIYALPSWENVLPPRKSGSSS